MGIGAAHLLERNELVEHAIVNHEEHGGVGGVVLQTEEALRGIIRLHVVHALRGDEALILFAVRRESYAAMKEHLQVRPHLVEGVLARELEHAGNDGHHPRRHAAEVGNAALHGTAGNEVAFLLEVGEQGHALRGHAHQVDQRIDVLDEDGAEVAHKRVRQVVVGCVASAQNEGASVEEAALGVVTQIEAHGIGAAGVVRVVQALLADGNEFALVVGGARRFGVPLHLSWPQHVLFAVSHAVDVAFQFLVGIEGHALCEVVVGAYAVEAEALTVFRVSRLAEELLQHPLLNVGRLRGITVQSARSFHQERAYNRCDAHI